MTTAKSILGIVTPMQSLAVASAAYGNIPRYKKRKFRRVRLKHLMKGTTNVLVGTSLTQATANVIGGMA